MKAETRQSLSTRWSRGVAVIIVMHKRRHNVTLAEPHVIYEVVQLWRLFFDHN